VKEEREYLEELNDHIVKKIQFFTSPVKMAEALQSSAKKKKVADDSL